MTILQQFSDEALFLWIPYFIVFLRVGTAMTFMPIYGESWMSVRIKVVASLILTMIMTPAVIGSTSFQSSPNSLNVIALLQEVLIGLLLGLVFRFFIMAIQTAGSIAAQSTSLAQLMGQTGMDPLPAIGHIMTLAALTILVIFGFHYNIIKFIVLTYDMFPYGKLIPIASIVDVFRQHANTIFNLAFSLAAPFLILSLLYNLTLGVINRAMPQLMVAFVGAPVISFAAILFLLLCIPAILITWLSGVQQFLINPF
ncbi:flagellar biosynthetic protein FliR [Cognatishimia sp. F0-27]|uniref:flagellar biosynthetic protein FliR n=1 Tax=Cognatishimia sp. F0-27 TaxID=2816855 RepID=UPI001D0C5B13|nr:flagellar biosynthetic protein FliR [Cognatishimia sp. F0-27]MCC1495111.1 flagellar biosynthetic protein FliR [Cognatishimia sp. F0-27]